MSGAVISSNVSLKIDPAYSWLDNQTFTGAGDTGVVTLIAAPAIGYLKFRPVPGVALPVDPTVTFTTNVPGPQKETEMQIYVAGFLIFNQPTSSANTATFTLNLASYNDFYLNNGLNIQYRMRGIGSSSATRTIVYPGGRVLVLAISNSP